jgi:hypothetical protein
MAGARYDPGRLRCLEDPERRRQATETVSQQPQPGREGINPKWTPVPSRNSASQNIQ